MSTSLLDVLVGQRVRLTVTKEVRDPAKGEERSHREMEIVGQLLCLPDSPSKILAGLIDHYVHGSDGERHAINSPEVVRIEVLDPVTDEVILFAKCTGEPLDRSAFEARHQGAQCCVHEVHVGGRPERQDKA